MNTITKIKGIVIGVMMAAVLVGCTQVNEGIDSGVKVAGTQTDAGSVGQDVKTETVSNAVDGQLTVHYIDVGQADATLLEAVSEGETYRVLIDTGNLGRNDTTEYLNALGVEDIDIVVGTHPHADHIGQMDKIIQNFDVGEVWMSGDTNTSQNYQNVMEVIKTSGVGYEEPRAGDVYDIGEMEVTVINPETLTGALNDGSIQMRVVFGDVDFLFTGDGETRAEQDALARGSNVSAKIMKLGHHGSKTSTIPAFFKAVNPEVAIYSAGKGNSYNHPSVEVVDRVQDAGVKLYGTDTHGTVIVTTDGKTYDVKTNKEGVIVPPTEGETRVEKQETVKEETVEPSEAETPPTGNCVDLNAASREALMTIVHIGDARVEDVIAGRPYSDVDSLTKVNGIAAGRLADIKTEGLACVK